MSDSTKFKAIKEEILSIEQLLLPIVLEKERESSKVRFSEDSALIDLFYKDSTEPSNAILRLTDQYLVNFSLQSDNTLKQDSSSLLASRACTLSKRLNFDDYCKQRRED